MPTYIRSYEYWTFTSIIHKITISNSITALLPLSFDFSTEHMHIILFELLIKQDI